MTKELMVIIDKAPVLPQTRHLMSIIARDEGPAVQAAALELMPHGTPDFTQLLSTPYFNRIPALIEGLGFELVHFLVCKLIYDLRACINVKNTMNDKQVMSCAGIIIRKCFNEHLGLQDLICFFEGIKMGQWGKLYDRLDCPVLSEMLENFRAARIEAFDNYQLELKTSGYSAREQQRQIEFDDKRGYVQGSTKSWPEKQIDVKSALDSLTKKYKQNE